jgi:hypothetical protein
MERIDVHDLPEEQARLVAAFVEFLRGWQQTPQDSAAQEKDWSAGSMMSFAQGLGQRPTCAGSSVTMQQV